MDEKEKKEKFKKLEEAACASRGHIIHRVIEVEMLINIYLAKHFSKDYTKENELLSLLFCTERITYDAKVEIFCTLLQKHQQDFFKVNKDIKSHLKKFGEIRNHMAHLHLNILDEAVQKEKIIGLTKWRHDKVEIKNYSYENINAIVSDLYTYYEIIGTLL